MAKLQGGTRIYGTANVDTYFYVNTYTIVNATGIYQTGVINATSHTVGTNFFANTTQLYHTGTLNIGTGNTLANSSGLFIANATGTVNAATISVGTSFVANTTQVTLSGIPLSANGSNGSATQVLTSNGSTGSPYWASASGGGFTNGASVAVSNLAFWNSASSARAYTFYNSTQNSVDLIFI